MPRQTRRVAAHPRSSQIPLSGDPSPRPFPRSLCSDTIPIVHRLPVQRNPLYPAGPPPVAGATPSGRDSAR